MPISIIPKSQALALVGEWVKEWKEGLGIEAGKSSIQTPAHFPKLITTPNPEMIVSAQSDPEFLKALQSADLAIPDGIGVVWAIKKLKVKSEKLKVEKISGIDLMESLILQPQKVAPYELHPLKVLLLGGRPGVAEKAADKCRGLFTSHNSQLDIRAFSGPQNIENISKSENNRLIAQINQFSPDLIFVAFGHPKQEKWLTANRERLTVGVAMAVGGALDQIANPSLRPPPYINSIGLGWLYRLLRQPWRWRRQLALVKFAGMVLGKKLQIPSSKIQ